MKAHVERLWTFLGARGLLNATEPVTVTAEHAIEKLEGAVNALEELVAASYLEGYEQGRRDYTYHGACRTETPLKGWLASRSRLKMMGGDR